MPGRFRVRIHPVPRTGAEPVLAILLRFLGPDAEDRARELLQSGGTVLERLAREAAEHTATRLREAGAEAEVEAMDAAEAGSLRVRLVSFGEQKIRVVRVVRQVTDLGLREAKELVESLGVVGEGLGRVPAEKIKRKLEAVGATVAVESEDVPEPTGPVDDDLFVVRGRVTLSAGGPAAGVLVRAFDRDLRSEQELGESATGAEGRYEIRYSRGRFRRAEKHRADLRLRVFNEVGVELEAKPAETVYNAARKEEVDLEIVEGQPVRPSEYERLEAFLDPVLDGAAPALLTADEITFLVHDTEIEELTESFPAGPDSISFLAHASRLGGEVDAAPEAFYGWAREDLGIPGETDPAELDLDLLLEQDDATLRDALEAAIDGDVIPSRFRNQLDAVLRRLRHARAERDNLPQRTFRGRVVDTESGLPLPGMSVRASRSGDDSDPLAIDTTDGEGAFRILPPLDLVSGGGGDISIELSVLTPDGERIGGSEVAAGPSDPVTIEVQLPEEPEPSVPGESVTLEELDADLGGALSNGLGRVLADRDVSDLADLRRLAGTGEIDDLESEFGQDTVRTLKAHAELSLVSSHAETRTGLIEKGYVSPVQIADAPLGRFVSDVGETVGEEKALGLGRLARAEVSYIDSVFTGLVLERDRINDVDGTFPGIDPDLVAELLPRARCSCECNHALSPSAYLADLLDYVTTHLDLEGPDQLTLEFLHERLHQPFDRLPVSCRYQEEQVRQVRICVEVLRGYVAAHQPPAASLARLERREDAYRFDVYQRLLERLGSTFSEIRSAITDDAERETLAARLGIADDHLLDGDLYFEPGELTETDLERLFGYRGTTDPLSEVGKPAFLEWQHARLARRWTEEDHPADEPGPVLVDPDLVEIQDLAPGSGLHPMLEDRRQFVESALADLRSRPRDLDGIDEILEQELETARDELKTKRDEAAAGTEISDFLEEHGLEADAFRRLHELVEALEDGEQLLNSEWADVHAIAVEAKKRQEHDDWRVQEFSAGVTISPEFFRVRRRDVAALVDVDPSLRWRLDAARRRDWERTLRTRIQQKQTLKDGLREAVSAVEEASLPELRDALVEASDAPGASLVDKAEWVTEQLQIDARADGCRLTTRVAQAIETLQNLVFSVRTGQLDPSVASFEPLPSDFDAHWRWLGSYATWKAATAVYLYPENVLHPALRMRRTPGFEKLVETTRTVESMSLTEVRAEGERYEQYFRDVCNLYVEAGCWAWTGRDAPLDLPSDTRLLFSFARAGGGGSGRLYWSAYDPEADDSDYAQTYWRELPGASSDGKVIGASYYDRVGDDAVICLFFLEYDVSALEHTLGLRLYRVAELGRAKPLLPLSLPDGVANAGVVVVQRSSPFAAPRVIVADRDRRELYHRSLNRSGTGWSEETDWQLVFSPKTVRVDTTVRFGDVPWGGGELSGSVDITIDQVDVPYYARVLVGGARDVESLPARPVAAFATGGAPSSPVDIVLRSDSDLLLTRFSVGAPEPRFVRLTKDMVPRGQLSHYERLAFENLSHSLGDIAIPGSRYRLEIRDVLDIGASPDARFVGATDEEVYWQEESTNGRRSTYRYPWSGGSRSEAASGVVLVPPIDGRRDDDPYIYHRDFGVGAGAYAGRVMGRDTERATTLAPVQIEYFDVADWTRMNVTAQERKAAIFRSYFFNMANRGPASNLVYLAEAYYFVPVHLGIHLYRQGRFTAALDYLRTVYDYGAETNEGAEIFDHAFLARDDGSTGRLERSDDWFTEPLNPHSIGRTRRDTYLRFTLLNLVYCLVEFADEQFTRDSSESLARARTLYVTALDLLDTEVLARNAPSCDELVVDILDDVTRRDLRGVYRTLIQPILRTGDREQARAVAESIVRTDQELSASDDSARIQAARSIVAAIEGDGAPLSYGDLSLERAEHRRRRSALLSAEPALAKPLDALSSTVRGGVVRRGASLATIEGSVLEHGIPRLDPDRLAGLGPTPYTPTANHAFCVPPNPVVRSLHTHASNNLEKLRTCRNIAGLKRQIEAYAASTDVESGLPSTSEDGVLLLATSTPPQPTPYRYRVLVDRAEHLTNIAQQIEASYLSAMQTRDAELYGQLRAEQDIGSARAGVRLQDIRVMQAEEQVDLAELQQDRAQVQVEHYDGLIEEGLLGIEKTAIGFMVASAALHASSAAAYSGDAVLGAVTFGLLGNPPAADAAAAASALAAASSSTASVLSTYARYERREQEWKFARRLARQDVRIGRQQIRIAETGVDVADQEREISALQLDHAEATADFLANKDLNAELYHWMTGVLRSVYAFFLRQAAATAKLAEYQLAFQRQEGIQGFIRSDYWKTTADTAMSFRVNGDDEDRLGLTGSARLLQDVYRLDQYAFQSDERKLQLSRTISLARVDPVAFQRFRETGQMTFETPSSMFDREFPGHYLRLVKRVRVSVIALVPPTRGIRATLASTGVSRVVTQNGVGTFQERVIRRNPELIAFTSPRDATGLFELDPQSEMLKPFEGSGVDTRWELRMPKPANPFDYEALADVLVTVEYTALHSHDYERQVIRELDPFSTGDRAFSFRHEFSDAWYDLHHPDLTDDPMVVTLGTRRADFPPNISEIETSQVALYFSVEDPDLVRGLDVDLQFTESGAGGSVGGLASPVDGLVSTRRASAADWLDIAGTTPDGEWKLSLPDREEVRRLFEDDTIEDLLLVVTYEGVLPGWPSG